MANQTITQLPSAGPITGDELIPIVQNGQTVKTTAQSIAASPTLTQTFLTLNQEPTLNNSRSLAGGTGIGLTDNGAQSTLQIALNGASGSLELAGTGIVAKDSASTVAARTLTASGAGLDITNGDGVSGNPTFALTGVAAAVANLGGTGIMAIQSGTTVGGVQILGTANQIAVANGNGAGNPTISIADDAVLPGTGAVTIPRGTTLQQPSGTDGQLRYNTSSSRFEGYSGGWQTLGSGDGSVTQITAGTGLTGGTITTTGTIAIANTGVSAGAYGGASKTLLTTVNAQGQLTNLSETDIAIANTQVSGLGTASTLNAGVANGVATLDAGGTVPLSQIPASLQGGVSYQGTWNATTNTPTLTSGVGTKGYYYVVDVAGSTDLDGITNWNVGDWAIFNGTIWQKIDNTDAVTSVNGYTGTVVLTASDIGGLGTMATQNANNVAITGGSIDNTVIGGTTPAAGTFTTLTATGQTSLGGAAGSESLRVLTPSSTGNYATVQGTSSSANIISQGFSNANIYVGANGTGSVRLSTRGTSLYTQMLVADTASAVNYVQVTGAATSGSPTISMQGSDSSISSVFQSKGSGTGAYFTNSAYPTNNYFSATSPSGVASANRLNAAGAATTFAPVLSAQGSDTNISQVFQSKGTGAIDLAAGSSGVNISNGGTVTALTLTAGGSGYTSIPTPVITAPTTAGGVQATATVAMAVFSTAITSGGTGYTVGDTLTVVGGTGTAATYTVAAVSAGVITSLNGTSAGTYTVLPSSPSTVTGGTGTGATLTINWQVRSGTFVITNAGSGYVEQPTVSFSGGGGSGAAAYATVGSGTVVKSVGSTADFSFPSGVALRLYDSGTSGVNFLRGIGAPANGHPLFAVEGSDTNIGLSFSSKGTGSLNFRTVSNSSTQMLVAHTASAVNYVQVTGAATGANPKISAQGSDSTVGFDFQTKGAKAYNFFTNTNNLQLEIPHIASVNWLQVKGSTSGSAPVVAVAGSDTDIDLALTPKGTGSVILGNNQANYYKITGGDGSTTNPRLSVDGSSTNTSAQIASKGTGVIQFITGGSSNLEQLRVAHTASAVNYVQVTGAATTGSPSISAQGSDTYIGLAVQAKSATLALGTRVGGNPSLQLLDSGSSPANYFRIVGSATAFSPVLSSQGSDTNISQVFQSKGTGAIDLAAGSSGVNISNGGTVTAITRTANGSGYTSIPTIAITAPTTAGGVQATATASLFANTATVSAGGTGYTLNDVVTLVGGTPAGSGATYTVTGVSGGVVTSVSPLNFQAYTALPSNPVSVTGGTGTGLTLTVTYGYQGATITNAGSGYVEQPTVTFSGGGGSGAAAFATVGNNTAIKSLGSQLNFYTPIGGVGFAVTDYTSTGNYWTAYGSSAAPYLFLSGSASNIDGAITSKGTGALRLGTNAGTDQFRVTHTASAVNYVQVTGAATNTGVQITAQGSDAAVGVSLTSKGSGDVMLRTNHSSGWVRMMPNNTEVVRATAVVNTVNYVNFTGAAAGSAPSMASAGSDTNIDLTLTPKGTGYVQFGTYTANMALTVQGYIEVKDSSGTVRKLAVIA